MGNDAAAAAGGPLFLAVRAAVAEALGMIPEELPDDAGIDVVPAWTSLQHLSVVAAVEERFDIQMEMDEMTTATNLPALVAVVARHRGDHVA